MNPSLSNRSLYSFFALSAVLFSCCFIVSCGSSAKSVQLAKDSVGMFHAQLDTEQYNAIYQGADEKFHSASTEGDFTKLLQAIHSKLGTVKEANLRNTGVAWFAGQGASVTLVYDTKFTEGSGTEQFVWHIKDDRAALYGYHINSNDLISK